MAAPLTTITATVVKTNDHGLVTKERPGEWLNISKYATPAPTIPPVGSVVELALDTSGFIREIRPLANTAPDSRQNPTTDAPRATERPAATRDVAITRLACLKAAAGFLATRPEAKAADVVKVAEAWESWVSR